MQYYVDSQNNTNSMCYRNISTRYRSDFRDDADAGYYVDSTGQTAQTACATGTYQPDTAGYYVDSTGQTTQTASAGTVDDALQKDAFNRKQHKQHVQQEHINQIQDRLDSCRILC